MKIIRTQKFKGALEKENVWKASFRVQIQPSKVMSGKFRSEAAYFPIYPTRASIKNC